jgi:Ras-related protein Rab-8A
MCQSRNTPTDSLMTVSFGGSRLAVEDATSETSARSQQPDFHINGDTTVDHRPQTMSRGRTRTRTFTEEDAEAEENIRQLAQAASLNGAVSRGAGEGGRGRGRSTSFHVELDDEDSDTTKGSSSGSDSDTSSNSSNDSNSSSNNGKHEKNGSDSGKTKKGKKRQVSKKTQDILNCRKLNEIGSTNKQPLSAVEKAERAIPSRGGRPSPTKTNRRRNNKKQKQQPYDQLVKILLLGDSGVGKTCLLTRFADKKYSPSLVTTAGIDFKVQYFEVNGIKVKCQIWDTAGQERFHVITKAYYKGAHGIALVYDVTDRRTLDNIDYWLGNIADNAQEEVEQVLIANKVDLPRVIPTEEGESVASARNIRYLETSAKTGTNVRSGKENNTCDVVFDGVVVFIVVPRGGY